jgi:hypothetical protein
VWIIGQFENRPGSVRVTLRRQSAPPADERCSTARKRAAGAPDTVPTEGSQADPQSRPRGTTG